MGLKRTDEFRQDAVRIALTLGRAIGLVAMAAIGILFMTGRMNWNFAASVAIGLVILFVASAPDVRLF